MDEQLRKLEREAAAGDAESAARLEAAERRSRLLPRWNPLTRVSCALAFSCPKEWDAMDVTGQPGVRHCDHCAKDVYEAPTEASFKEHAKAGRCVSVPPGAGYAVSVGGEPIPGPTILQPDSVRLGGVAVDYDRLTGPARRTLSVPRLLSALVFLSAAAYGVGGWLGWWSLFWR
jgi:hypothetical protein